MERLIRNVFLVLPICVLFIGAEAQTTAFTYQGNLVVAGVPANGNYDFQFSPFGVEEFYLLAESSRGRLRFSAIRCKPRGFHL